MHGEVTMGCCGHGCCVADPLAASSSIHSPLALQAAQNLHLQCRNMLAQALRSVCLVIRSERAAAQQANRLSLGSV